MIELVPYMLMLVWASPGQPDRFEVERVAELYADAAACERAGMARAAAETGKRMQHHCLALPGRDEFDRLFRALDAKREPADPPADSRAPE